MRNLDNILIKNKVTGAYFNKDMQGCIGGFSIQLYMTTSLPLYKHLITYSELHRRGIHYGSNNMKEKNLDCKANHQSSRRITHKIKRSAYNSCFKEVIIYRVSQSCIKQQLCYILSIVQNIFNNHNVWEFRLYLIQMRLRPNTANINLKYQYQNHPA